MRAAHTVLVLAAAMARCTSLIAIPAPGFQPAFAATSARHGELGASNR